MAEHHIDDEQLDRLKRWWHSYGKVGLFVVVLALASWLGWREWEHHSQQNADAASLIYIQMMEANGQGSTQPSAEQRAKVTELANALKDGYAGTTYADFAHLMLAKTAVADARLDVAEKELRAVMERAGDDGLALIARLRLARIQTAQGKYADALALLETPVGGAMASNFAEARGDAHLAQGDKPAARAAYQSALDGLAVQDPSRQLLSLKLNQVLPPPAAARSEENG